MQSEDGFREKLPKQQHHEGRQQGLEGQNRQLIVEIRPKPAFDLRLQQDRHHRTIHHQGDVVAHQNGTNEIRRFFQKAGNQLGIEDALLAF